MAGRKPTETVDFTAANNDVDAPMQALVARRHSHKARRDRHGMVYWGLVKE